MAAYHHYCERCGEDDGGDAIRCDGCGIQMCGSCATRDEIETEECAACRRKSAETERKDELLAEVPNVLPAMRAWYLRHVVGG